MLIRARYAGDIHLDEVELVVGFAVGVSIV